MASSKVMSSTSPANSDRSRDSLSIRALATATALLQSDRSKSFGSINMDDFELFKNIYNDPEVFPNAGADHGGGGSELPVDCASASMPKRGGGKSVEEVWNDIIAVPVRDAPVTLEDFLTKAAAVSEEDVTIPEIPQPPPPQTFVAEAAAAAIPQPPPLTFVTAAAAAAIPQPPPQTFVTESAMLSASHFPVAPAHMQTIQTIAGTVVVDPMGFGNGRMVVISSAAGASGSGGVRGKRRAVEEEPLDKATQQKQRRMIKNRESAARSRERKQVHTTELEYLVRQLEDENARLLMEEAEQSSNRYIELMDNLIPVEEKPRQSRQRALRRVNSTAW